MEANNVFGYFDYISDEISYKILSYLQPSQLFKASEINKRMNSLANDALLWKPFFTQEVQYDFNNPERIYVDAKRIFHPSFSKMPS